MDIMPSRELVIQEYKKHGVCSGLDPRGYFNAAREAYRSIRIPEGFQDLPQSLSASPDEIRHAFLDANKQLSDDMIQVVCSRRLLREVRICFSKDLTPRPCSQREQNRKLCNYDTVIMPPFAAAAWGREGVQRSRVSVRSKMSARGRTSVPSRTSARSRMIVCRAAAAPPAAFCRRCAERTESHAAI